MKAPSYNEEQAVLHQPFDIARHKKVFVNYCETIMWPNGKVEYAIPSHSEKLIKVYAKAKHMSVEAVKDMLRSSTDFPYYAGIMSELGIAFIWNDSIYNVVPLTDQQKSMLAKLVAAGVVSDKLLRDIS